MLIRIFVIQYILFAFCFPALFSPAQGSGGGDFKERRDPFIPLVTSDGRLLMLKAEEGKKEVNLDGIIYDPNGLSYAVVSGIVAKIGDKVGDYQVLKIEEKKVTFIREGEILEVELRKEGP